MFFFFLHGFKWDSASIVECSTLKFSIWKSEIYMECMKPSLWIWNCKKLNRLCNLAEQQLKLFVSFSQNGKDMIGGLFEVRFDRFDFSLHTVTSLPFLPRHHLLAWRKLLEDGSKAYHLIWEFIYSMVGLAENNSKNRCQNFREIVFSENKKNVLRKKEYSQFSF